DRARDTRPSTRLRPVLGQITSRLYKGGSSADHAGEPSEARSGSQEQIEDVLHLLPVLGLRVEPLREHDPEGLSQREGQAARDLGKLLVRVLADDEVQWRPSRQQLQDRL